jgi:hypothetical protein
LEVRISTRASAISEVVRGYSYCCDCHDFVYISDNTRNQRGSTRHSSQENFRNGEAIRINPKVREREPIKSILANDAKDEAIGVIQKKIVVKTGNLGPGALNPQISTGSASETIKFAKSNLSLSY